MSHIVYYQNYFHCLPKVLCLYLQMLTIMLLSSSSRACYLLPQVSAENKTQDAAQLCVNGTDLIFTNIKPLLKKA